MSDAVLIVDDEQHILQSLKRLLRRDGYEIHLADCGQAALEILANTEIAVIICDQRMPGMTGAEVLARVYKLCPDTIRITLTGYTDLAAAQVSINEGHVSHFLLKPWDDEHLRSIVQDGVQAYRLVLENRRLEALTRRQKEELEAWNQRLEEQVQERTEELRAQNENLLQLQRRVEQSLRDTVGVLADTLEAHSPNLGIHCKRVAKLARQLASQLDVDDEESRDIEFAAHLHDLGKLARVAGEDTAKGRRRQHEKSPHLVHHTEAGYAILSKVSGFERIALAVRHQKEQFDGSGHPDGLKRDGIPLASRIIAVINAYDKAVFCTATPADVSHEAGRNILQEGRGNQFDPYLVDQLLQYLDESGAAAAGNVEVELSPKRITEGMVLSRPIHNLDGVLLLKEGARLTPDLIEHIRTLSEADPLLTSVFVSCEPETTRTDGGDEPGDAPEDPPNAPQPSTGAVGQHAVDNPNVKREDEPPILRDTMACAPAIAGSSTIRSESPDPARQGKKVLVVDDSASICKALKRELRPANIEAVATESGWTALNLVETTRFDAALIDLNMPAMSGEDLVKRLCQCAPALPCIILTGNATAERVATLVAKPNVAGILAKPWDHDRLISTITAAIARNNPKLAREPV